MKARLIAGERYRPSHTSRAYDIDSDPANDPLVGIAELRAFDRNAVEIAGSGHNPHIQAPLALASLVLGALTPTL
jgi:hypothetical protein